MHSQLILFTRGIQMHLNLYHKCQQQWKAEVKENKIQEVTRVEDQDMRPEDHRPTHH